MSGAYSQQLSWAPLQWLHSPETTNFALLILNQPIPNDLLGVLKRLWKYSTVSALIDGGANHWYTSLEGGGDDDDYLPSYISGDFDSIRPDVLEYYEGKSCEVYSTPDQDETDFTKSLRCLANRMKTLNISLDHVVAVSGTLTSQRTDHMLANFNALYKAANILPNMPIYLLSDKSINFRLISRHSNMIDATGRGVDDGDVDDWCSLVPLGRPSHSTTTSGLKYNVRRERLEFGHLISTSNRISPGVREVTVCCSEDLLWSMGINLSSS